MASVSPPNKPLKIVIHGEGPDYPIFVRGEVTYLPRGKPIDVTQELIDQLDISGVEYVKG